MKQFWQDVILRVASITSDPVMANKPKIAFLIALFLELRIYLVALLLTVFGNLALWHGDPDRLKRKSWRKLNRQRSR